jgi:quercetin dioxygenase-like cupin family protein
MTSPESFFPPIVTRLPAADIPVPGLTSFIAQAGDQQFVFMSFAEDVEVPEHSHAAQWGVVLDGTMELRLAGRELTLARGDQYSIPDGAVHSARIHGGYRDLTLFDQQDRYVVLG